METFATFAFHSLPELYLTLWNEGAFQIDTVHCTIFKYQILFGLLVSSSRPRQSSRKKYCFSQGILNYLTLEWKRCALSPCSYCPSTICPSAMQSLHDSLDIYLQQGGEKGGHMFLGVSTQGSDWYDDFQNIAFHLPLWDNIRGNIRSRPTLTFLV